MEHINSLEDSLESYHFNKMKILCYSKDRFHIPQKSLS